LGDGVEGLEFVQNAMSPLGDPGSVNAVIEESRLPPLLGEYRIIREVGRGGMGVVYEAEQLPLGRRVALKVLPSTASLDSPQRERFQVEAQATALLHHEHIVPVFGIGRDQGIPYFAMQFIDGRSLTDLIRSQAGFARLSVGSARGHDNLHRATAIYEKLTQRFADRIWYRTGLIEML
jgi:eukaryotic-like serine/threonine-protein kinase